MGVIGFSFLARADSSYWQRLAINLKPVRLVAGGQDVTPANNQFNTGKANIPVALNYLGTTYIPLRYANQLLGTGKPISWDSSSRTIHLGAGAARAGWQNGAGVPSGAVGAAIKAGHDEFVYTNTNALTAGHVGNDLTCENCHFDGGTTGPGTGSMIGSFASFPTLNPMTGKAITLEDRIDNCFARSMNGTPLPYDSAAMTNLVAYLNWISRGVPVDGAQADQGYAKMATTQPANPANGQVVYAKECVTCHGTSGQGNPAATFIVDGVKLSAPPIAGPESYNTGAGMSHPKVLAGFVHVDMPFGQSNLSAQDSVDVAAYVDSLPRPLFNSTSWNTFEANNS